MRWKAGRLFKINLSNGACGFAMTLQEPELAFFNCFNPMATAQEILSSSVLWRLWVMRQALKKQSWDFIAQVAYIPAELQKPVPRFKKDLISGECSLYVTGSESQATKEQCAGLESASVWSFSHMQDRLQDHLAGVPNKLAISLLP